MNRVSSYLLIMAFCAFNACTNTKRNYYPDISGYASPKGTEVYKPDSASIADHYQVPEWFRDAKFGIFIHWGPYAVPAFYNEWYASRMYNEGYESYKHHIETYGKQTEFGYKDFIPLFKGENFNANEWVSLFKEAGAKYVVPVAEHHDGFSMYNSVVNEWNSVKMGPKRDVVGEIKKAAEKNGLHFGLSNHRAEHAWYFTGGTKFPSDVQDPKYRSLYGELLPRPDVNKTEGSNEESRQGWLEHIYELIDLYEPELLWFDWTVGMKPFQPTFYKFIAYYYNSAIDWNKGVVINTKGGYAENIQVDDFERGKSGEVKKYPWQTDTSMGERSWSYLKDERYKSPNKIIDELADIVSKNGNLLLNVGPKADGTFPPEVHERLREIGSWLKVNGEAIYGSRPWVKASEGEVITGKISSDRSEPPYTAQDICFTTNGDALYAISLDWNPEGVVIHSINDSARVKEVSMLGSDEKVSWKHTRDGLKVSFPKEKPSEYAHVLKIMMGK
jgi:alpha-L-fucosidase